MPALFRGLFGGQAFWGDRLDPIERIGNRIRGLGPAATIAGRSRVRNRLNHAAQMGASPDGFWASQHITSFHHITLTPMKGCCYYVSDSPPPRPSPIALGSTHRRLRQYQREGTSSKRRQQENGSSSSVSSIDHPKHEGVWVICGRRRACVTCLINNNQWTDRFPPAWVCGSIDASAGASAVGV
jgi:hypothetical protein